ncbi:MAG: DUF1207 domain-containing protein [Chlamydiae bacterium]|nr:DUF1207 domain-containing protein [Chlamydiota bacterium]
MKRNSIKVLFGVLTCFTGCLSLLADTDAPLVDDDLAPQVKVFDSGSLTYVTNELLTRTDSLPVDEMQDATDPYLEGYIQALVDMHFYEYRVIVTVKNHHVFLSNLPTNELIANAIVSFVGDLPGVKSVDIQDLTEEEKKEKEKYTEQPRVNGIWFPQSTIVFQPLIADPREPYYYAAYRYGDKVIGKQVASVALGDDFPFFRWRDVLRWHGDMQIGIQGGVWAVFNYWHIQNKPDNQSCELVNADYFFGIPLTYGVDRWAFRLRLYHISSHLGDEFLVNNPEYYDDRVNPSFEALDFTTSYQFSGHLRAYGGPGVIIHSDSSFPMKTLYVKYGAEVHVLGKKLYYHKLYGTPFLALHFENWQVRDWNLDLFIKTGYELSKLQGIGRKMRVYIDYHHGYSYEGQFFLRKTQYGELGLSWGF